MGKLRSAFRCRFFSISVLILSHVSTGHAFQGAAHDHPPVDAVKGIVAAFEKHPVVVIGEWVPGIREMGDFYIRLVRDPVFQHTVQDIVIQFASRNNQPLLDRYIAGEDIPMDQVRQIWRDTTKAGLWDSPIYAEWLAAIREVNREMPPDRRFHVLAGDTAVDWSRITTQSEWKALEDSNASFADVVINQVLAKHRRALVVLNGQNVAKLGHEDKPNTSTMIEARYPGAAYVVIHRRILHDPDEAVLQLPGHPETPTLYDLAGTALGQKPIHENGGAPLRWVDAWLYVGPVDSLTRLFPSPGSLEASYLKEVDRRSTIQWGDLRARRFLGQPLAQ